jgi:hypothetical protein
MLWRNSFLVSHDDRGDKKETEANSVIDNALMLWRAFLDTYRTLCLAPTPEIREIFEQLRGGSTIASAC